MKLPREPFARLEWSRSAEQTARPVHFDTILECIPETKSGSPSGVEGQLFLADNLDLMSSLPEELEGGIDLIYADPPFLSGNEYRARIGAEEDSRRPAEWKLARGYQDTWEDGSDYLSMLAPRIRMMHRLLAPTGTLYMHLDWHAAAYARILLDEVFGPDRFLNEIIWVYHGPSPIRSAFNRKHDTILVYTKSSEYTFNVDAVRIPYDESTVKTFAASPRAGFGRTPDLERGKVPEDWWYFPVVARLHNERTGFPTQKPEALLERIITASSNPDDLVADFFCGSGSVPAVASRLGRRWLACDALPLAVQTTHRRLLLLDETPLYSFKADRRAGWDGALRPRFKAAAKSGEVTVQLTGLDGGRLREAFPDNLACWEVDWDYDGEVFRSRSHAARQWRKGTIEISMSPAAEATPGAQIAVRASDLVADYGMVTLETDPP